MSQGGKFKKILKRKKPQISSRILAHPVENAHFLGWKNFFQRRMPNLTGLGLTSFLCVVCRKGLTMKCFISKCGLMKFRPGLNKVRKINFFVPPILAAQSLSWPQLLHNYSLEKVWWLLEIMITGILLLFITASLLTSLPIQIEPANY